MAENVLQSIEFPVPLSLFGSRVTEMDPADLPEGTSPDNQDVVFLPGGVLSRPCMRRWLSGLTAGTTVTYVKTFVNPQGVSLNLILTSDGSFWVQNTQVPPYTPTLLGSVSPGSYCSSVTAFGKELITFHDTVKGTDIPRTYDGQYFDRATQGGPGAPPNISNTIIPASTLIGNTTGIVANISTALGTDGSYSGGHLVAYLQLLINTTTPHGLSVGMTISIAGNSVGAFNVSNFIIFSVPSPTSLTIQLLSDPSDGVGNGGTVTQQLVSLTRNNNSVSANTQTPHGLLVGYQVQISGVSDTVVGTEIDSIVIDNESIPGVAIITTQTPHGLLPQNLVNLIGVPGVVVGGGISTISRSAEVVSVGTTVPHGLSIGALVTIAGVADNTYNGQFTVLSVPDDSTFTYSQVDTDSSSHGGTVTLDWIPNTPGLLTDYYTVVSCPTPTTFQISVTYSDGTWGVGGSVTFAWNGIFYVTSVITNTQFNYQQYGPNDISTDEGTVTPYAQISPGVHQCVVLFQTETGFITAPSPPVVFVANGGQYLTITSIPLGPPNVVARFIAFTGAGGDSFFYIPVPGIVNGIQVSSSTSLYDNVTVSMVVDFSDLTLFDSIAIDIPGNNFFEMSTLGPCLGVTSYANRAAWYGMKNSVPNFLNLGFDGGYNVATIPLGWNVITPGGHVNTQAKWGFSWTITGSGTSSDDGQISQSAYADYYEVPILSPSTFYSFDWWLWILGASGGTSGTVNIDIYSPGQGILASYSIPVIDLNATPTMYSVNLATEMPAVMPADAVLRVYSSDMGLGTIIAIDEIEIYPTMIPTVPEFFFSYVNRPEALDQETGILGGSDDPTPIMTSFEYRDSFLFLTQSKLHETNDLPNLEPDNWKVREVSNNCGACGPRACSTGENFSTWLTSPSSTPPVGRGLYIYTGGNVYKLSQEIQPDFDSINGNSQSTVWVQNDSVTRRIYVGVPDGSATAPNLIYVLDYREMDSAAEIAGKPPIHISFTGKMICSDLSRKWTKWNVAANCGAIVYVPTVGLQFCVGGGNGQAPGDATGFNNAYWFDSTLYTDQDYGQVNPYYTTYFFVNHEMEQSLQIGLHRKLFKRYYMYVSGVGQLQLTPLANSLLNPWPSPPLIPLSLSPATYDVGDGLNVSTERCAFKIASIPNSGQTDNFFSISKLIITLSQEPIAPLRFGAV